MEIPLYNILRLRKTLRSVAGPVFTFEWALRKFNPFFSSHENADNSTREDSRENWYIYRDVAINSSMSWSEWKAMHARAPLGPYKFSCHCNVFFAIWCSLRLNMNKFCENFCLGKSTKNSTKRTNYNGYQEEEKQNVQTGKKTANRKSCQGVYNSYYRYVYNSNSD